MNDRFDGLRGSFSGENFFQPGGEKYFLKIQHTRFVDICHLIRLAVWVCVKREKKEGVQAIFRLLQASDKHRQIRVLEYVSDFSKVICLASDKHRQITNRECEITV